VRLGRTGVEEMCGTRPSARVEISVVFFGSSRTQMHVILDTEGADISVCTQVMLKRNGQHLFSYRFREGGTASARVTV
jgi:hypothetical protein